MMESAKKAWTRIAAATMAREMFIVYVLHTLIDIEGLQQGRICILAQAETLEF